MHTHIPKGRNTYGVSFDVVYYFVIVVDDNGSIKKLPVTQ